MRQRCSFFHAVLFLGAALTAPQGRAQVSEAPARWAFHRSEGATPLSDTGGQARLEGQYAYVKGVAGEALRFDGYTTSMQVPAKALPSLGSGFTVEAWVALNTYPWNHLPIADQEKARQEGYCLELDAFGHLSFSASVNGQWQTVRSTQVVPLKQWTHAAGVFTVQHGKGHLAAYVNGQLVAEMAVAGELSLASTDLLIGRVREPELPFPEAEIRPAAPISFSLDGLLDELSITGRSLTSKELLQDFVAARAPTKPVLPYQKMPSGPPAAGSFGAFYTGLRYEDGWDNLRRIDDNSDVVVRFDDSPSRLVFWQGLNYVPAWVSGEDKWYTDEFLEVWDTGCPDGGDCEPMSDKQERFSHVNITESNDVRAVVHWRYALTEVVGTKGAWPNPRTGWTDWADEYWTIYPDGVAVRKQVLHSDHPEAVHEWQETIVLHQAGNRPEDDIDDDAVTLGNMSGETRTFSWTPKKDTAFTDPQGPTGMVPLSAPNMQRVNLKSVWKPFQIVPPQGATADFYNNEKSYFTFECWNHWPVAQIASSDRPCITSDRPSHSSLSHLFWQNYAQTANSATKILLSGLTRSSLQDLLPLARSWITPPVLKSQASDPIKAHFDPTQRAYLIDAAPEVLANGVTLTLEASETSPAVNPAFLLSGWGDRNVQVTVNGHELTPGKQLRAAHVSHLDRTDLLLWLPMQSRQPVHIVLAPAR